MKKHVARYFKEYKWSNIAAMIRNNRRDPEICDEDFTGKLAVITGATSGIGYLTAKKFASHGSNLLCINRNPEKSAALKAEIESTYGVVCDTLIADFSILEDIHRVADTLRNIDTPIDVVVHNAGNFLTKRELTPEGIDKVFMVHHLSSFVMNIQLMEKLRSEQRARIILVNSEGHRFAAWGLHIDDLNWERRRYSGLKSYGSAKLAQLLTMRVFDEYFREMGVTINAMHPGAVKSESGGENGRFYKTMKKHVYEKMLRSTEISAEAIYFLATSEKLEGVSGKFFNLTTEEEPAPPALDMEAANEIWSKSLELGRVQDIILRIDRQRNVQPEARSRYG